MTIQYLFMKVGFGNSLLKACQNEPDDTAGFYVGFSEFDLSHVCSHKDSNGFFPETVWDSIKNHYKTQNKNQNPSTQGMGDFLRLVSFSDSRNRANVRLVTFSKLEMEIWEISNEIRYAEDEDIDKIVRNLQSEPTDYSLVCSKFNAADKKDPQTLKTVLKSYILPVRRVCKPIPRSSLLPTINSISVYRSFTSGTCRRIASADSDRQKDLGPIFKDSITEFYEYNGVRYPERAYGHFMRKCLDYYCSDDTTSLQTTLKLHDDDVSKVALFTLNPGQLETLTMLLMMDLGFIPEIGFANALPFIDYQGRFDTEYAKQANVSRAQAFQIISQVFELPKTGKWFEEDVIKIQCKNYNRSQAGSILFLDYKKLPTIKSIVDSHHHLGLFKNAQIWLQNLSSKFADSKNQLRLDRAS